jgi:hypothetical protein
LDQDPQKSRSGAAGNVTRDRPAASQSDEERRAAAATRKQKQREREKEPGTGVGGRGGRSPLGNRFRFDLGPLAKAGESLGAQEAEEQLYHAHVAVAKVMRSKVDMAELKEEFEVAGESYATVANHIWTPLRVMIRLIAPLVLAGALIAIWAAILAETPWVQRLGAWWANRDQEEAPPPAPEQPQQARPHVVQEPTIQPPHSPAPEGPTVEQPPHPPVPNVRAMRQR